jgi:hypothetical protein
MTETENVESRKRVAIERLTERYSHDELPMDEYERLVADIHRASSVQELAVVEDIVGGKIGAAPSSGAGNSPAQNRDAENGFLNEDLVPSCVAIFAERAYRGNWLRKPNIAASTVLASQVFDFTDTDLPAGQTLLEAVAVLGSIDIIVPKGVAVRIDVSPILGEVKVARGVDTSEREGKPLLVITGNAILGSVTVRLS